MGKRIKWEKTLALICILSLLDRVSTASLRNNEVPVSGTRKWYSQSGQDRCLIEHIFQHKTSGFYIDMAANDAKRLSNTYLMDRNLSWRGLCVEANAQYTRGLIDERVGAYWF